MKKPVMELRNISKFYTMGETVVRALDNVSLKILPGDLISIIGSSGSGKSTLLHILGLLDNPTKGEILVDGKDINTLSEVELAEVRNRTIGFVFQQFNLLPRTSVLENVLLPSLYNSRLGSKVAFERATEILKELGMGNRSTHFPNQLSGGQQQRVAIARALICNPPIILADEPTGNLDSKTGKEIIQLLLDLNKKQDRTVAIVTHDLKIARLGRRRIFLADGKIAKEEKG